MEVNIANLVTLLILDHLISLGFIFMLVSKLLGGKPVFQQRQAEHSEEQS